MRTLTTVHLLTSPLGPKQARKPVVGAEMRNHVLLPPPSIPTDDPFQPPAASCLWPSPSWRPISCGGPGHARMTSGDGPSTRGGGRHPALGRPEWQVRPWGRPRENSACVRSTSQSDRHGVISTEADRKGRRREGRAGAHETGHRLYRWTWTMVWVSMWVTIQIFSRKWR